MVNTEGSDVYHPVFMNYACVEVRIKFLALLLHCSYMSNCNTNLAGKRILLKIKWLHVYSITFYFPNTHHNIFPSTLTADVPQRLFCVHLPVAHACSVMLFRSLPH